MLRGSLVLILALAMPALSPAGAAEPAALPASGLVEILPVAEALGDGATVVEVRVVAVDATGAAMPTLDLKPGASSGTAANWRPLSPGLYAFDFTPPSVEEATTVTLSVSGKTSSRAAVSARLDLALAPPPNALTATPKPERLVLGKSDGGTLLVDSKEDVLVRVSAGEIQNLTDMGAKKTARYLPPKVNFPQVAILTFAATADPGRIVGYTTIKLDGSVDYPVNASPNASVMLEVADGNFGPVDASPEGKALVPIVVPPGVGRGKVVSVVDGKTTEEELDLRIPESKRIALFPLPAVIPADSGITVPVRVAIVTPSGEPDTDAKPVFTASAGKIGEAKHEGNGVYVASWTPADGDEAGTAKIEVVLGSGKVQNDALEVRTSPRRATKLAVTEPAEVPAEGAVTVVVSAEGAGGPLAGRSLNVVAAGAELEATTERGEGLYEVKLARTAGEPFGLDLSVQPDITDNPLRHVVVAPGADLVRNDGTSATTLTVATVDAFGYPVPGIDVALSVEAGDGKLAQQKLTTDAFGLARVEYTAGTAAALVRVRATAGQATGAAALLQAPATTAPVDLLVGGSAAVRAITDSWDDAAIEWPAGPPAAEAAVAAAPKIELAAPDAPAKSVEIVAEPTVARPGAEVAVKVTPKAEDGKPIPGQALDLLTSAGSFGAITEENGTYTAVLTLPKDAEGEIKLSAIAPSGAMQLVTITADPNAAGPIAAKTAEPVAPKPEKVRAPVEPGERPWLRARVAGIGSLYRYEQAPSEEPGALLPQPLALGAGGGSPATPFGGELDVRGWLEELPYLGFHGMIRMSRYAIASAAFNDVAPDSLYNVQLDITGRYPFAIGPDQFWVGAKAGYHYNDFIHFTGCLEPGCKIDYAPLGLSGVGLGVEMGAEVADLYFLTGYTHGFAYASVPYSSTVDVNVGYQLHSNVFADLGFTAVMREVVLNGADSGIERGSIADQQMIFKLGGGVSF